MSAQHIGRHRTESSRLAPSAASHREVNATWPSDSLGTRVCRICQYVGRHRGYDPTATPGGAWYGVKP